MEIYQKPNHKRYFKSQLSFLILSLIIGIALFTTICFADFTDDFNSPSLDPAWSIVNNGLSYSLTDNPGNLRIYFNGKQGSQGFGYTFSGKQWVFETKVHYNMNPLYSYLGVPAPGQEFGQGLAITGVDAGGKGFELAARVLNGYMDTIIVNALGWEAGEWDAASQYWNGIYGLYSGCGDGTYYFRLIRDNNAFSMFYSIDGISWQQSYSDIEDAGILSDQNSIALGALFNALATTSGTAYVEYDYVKISTGQVTLFVKDAVDFSNPNFPRIGQPVLDDPQRLASGGREVKIAVADGVTRLLLMLDVSESGNADFWVDNAANGILSSINNQSYTNINISNIPSVTTTQGEKIFAVYKVPDNFVSNSQDEHVSEREIIINGKYTSNSGRVQNFSQKIKLIRPPVVLIHGIWAGSDVWTNSNSGFEGVLKNDIRGIQISLVDYKTSNASYFVVNWPIVSYHVRTEINKLRCLGVAVSQVDIIAHSMGGLLSRIFSQMKNLYETKDNFKEGYINKLITIDTAHYGAIPADLITWLRDGDPRAGIVLSIPERELFKLCFRVSSPQFGPIDEGAVDEQTVKHLKIDAPLKPSSIPSFTAVGDITLNKNILDFADDLDPPLNALFVILKWFGVDTTFYYLPSFLDYIQETDCIVEGISQRGGLCGQATQTWAHSHGLAIKNPDVQKKAIFLLNSDVKTGNFGNFN